MKVTTQSERITVVRTARIEDGPVLAPAYHKRRFQVDLVSIEYTMQDGRFETEPYQISLHGHWVRKDDTLALNRATNIYPDGWNRRGFTPQYAFLDKVIDLLRPAGGLTMHACLDHEVGI